MSTESFLVGHHGPPEPSADFNWSAVDGAVDPDPTEQPPDSVTECAEALSLRLAAATILRIITKGAGTKLAGKRAHILAHSLKLSGYKTQTELAHALHMSQGRVSQILISLKGSLGPQTLDET